jgi:hypothetical protein
MDSPITDAELDAIEWRCDSASPAPWEEWVEAEGGTGGCDVIIIGGPTHDGPDMYVYHDVPGGGVVPVSAADLHFIANARQDLPRLVRDVHRLRATQG